MERPAPIHVSTILMCITNFAGLFLVNWGHRHAATLFVLYCILIAIGYAVLYFFWHGHNWARWLVLATSVLCLWNLWELRKLGRVTSQRVPIYNGPVRTGMVIAEGIIALYLLYYLNTKPAKAWFEHTKRALTPTASPSKVA